MAFLRDPLLLALLLSATGLALWVIVRFPEFGPRTLGVAAVHVAAAFATGYVVGPAMRSATMLPVPGADVLALLVVALPPLVYFLLAMTWVFRALQRHVGAYE